jgi:hypothetical protein
MEEKKTEQQASVFHLFSLGISVENKPRNSTQLNVLASEKSSAADGEINYNPQESTRSFTDALGNQQQVKTTAERSLVCEWLPSEDNRATPPDIMRNEKIEIWRLGDSDQYYWRSMGLSNKLRTLESVVYTWNASPNPGGAGIDFKTCYFMAISAHDQHFTIGTSKANGEPYAWTFQINTKTGEFTLCDDIGNEFEIVSKEGRLQLKNMDGTFIKVERKHIEMNASEYIDFTCGGSNWRMTPDSIKDKTSNHSSESTSHSFKTGSFTVQAGTTSFKTGSFAITG